ncbi:PEPxxWA-CTERM sorting domain-containing protein [Thermaurantiacus sp.]
MKQMFGCSKAVVLAGAFALGGAAQAMVVAGGVTGGSGLLGCGGGVGATFAIASPGVVDANSTDDCVARAWDELPGVVLAAPLSVDFLAGTGMPGVLPAGTRIDSHGFHLDPPGGPQYNYVGFVTFNRPIIAVITSGAWLVASDFLGDPGTTYNSFGNRGLEITDSFTLSPDKKTLNFDFTARTPGDNIRVLTYVPEPATWAMLIAGFGLVGAAARRYRREARAITA